MSLFVMRSTQNYFTEAQGYEEHLFIYFDTLLVTI